MAYSKPGRGGEELLISHRRGETEAKRVEAAIAAVLAQNWGASLPVVATAMDALKLELGRA